jgi:type IV pilus assembly protein PilQ
MKFKHIYSRFIALAALLLPILVQAADGGLASQRNSIESMMVSKAGGSTVIKVGLRQAMASAPSHFSIANPARLVFDLPNIGNGLGYNSKTLNEGGLRSLNVVEAGDRSRLVLNLDKLSRFELRQDDKFLYITLLEDGGGAGSAPMQQGFAGGEQKGKHGIRDIQFKRGKDGAGIVVVDMSASDGAIDINQKGARLHVLFKKTQLPESLRRRLDVVDFATPITAVNTRVTGDDVAMEIIPKGLWEHVAFQSDNQFVVEVRPVTEDPNKLFQGSRSGYQGEAISLNFQNIPLRELLHVFAEITNFNIVVSDSVTGNVSLRLNDVPWDHALEIVLQQKNLAMRKSGNVLWIAPRDELAARDKLEVEARDAAVAAEAPRLEIFQLNYQKAEDFAAMLAPDPSKGGVAGKSSASATFLSPLGKVTIDKRTNQVFIYDVPSKLEVVRGLLSKIDKAARQVLIEARIVEADTSFSKALGARIGGADLQGLTRGHNLLGSNSARWGIAGSQEYVNYHVQDPDPTVAAPLMMHVTGTQLTYDTAKTVAGAGGSTSLSGNVAGGSNFVNLPISGAAGQFALALFNSRKTKLLTLELSALEADGRGKTISSPRVLTADQVEATIEQGYRIPYPTASSSGAISIAYINATLSLKVKPQITPDGRVMMNIKINKDAPGEESRWGYTIKTKEIKSDVLIENGGTVVIGGVFEQVESESSARVPFLGDLPYVGFLFKQKSRREVSTELIIMITPKVVDETLAVKM